MMLTLSLLWLMQGMSLGYRPVMSIHPHEINARRLVKTMAEHFPSGGTSRDLLIQFETDHSLAKQSFYYALKYARQQRWLVKRQRFFRLNPNGRWRKPASTGQPNGISGEKVSKAKRLEMENNRLEFLLGSRENQVQQLQDQVDSLSGGCNGTAVASLVRIVSGKASTRQKLKACSIILGYRVDRDVSDRTKRFLESVCDRGDVPLDYKLQAAELLRRSEDPRIAPSVERPSPPVRFDTAEEIAERSERRRKHIELQAQKNAEEMARELRLMSARAPVSQRSD
jgi:hypothetical protein